MAIDAFGGAGMLSGDPTTWASAVRDAEIEHDSRLQRQRQRQGQATASASVGATAAKPLTTGNAGNAVPKAVVLENHFLKVVVDPTMGIASVIDKATNTSVDITHELVSGLRVYQVQYSR
jgi:hypothetical protein